MNLYLYLNHNYFNRKIEVYSTISEYEEQWGNPAIVSSVSFNPNDGVSTSHIINYPGDESTLAGRAQAASYCILVDDNDDIVSRWWITDTKRVRAGQMQITLLRDVIADYKDVVINAPSFIKKAYISSVNDPAIFNNEAMTFNQIKTSEAKIKDASNCAWYVGYLSKDLTSKPITITIPPANLSGSYGTVSEYPFSKYTLSNPFKDYTDITSAMFCSLGTGQALLGLQFGWGFNGEAKDPPLTGNWSKYSVPGMLSGLGYSRGIRFNGNSPKLPNLSDFYNYTTKISWEPKVKALLNVPTDSAVEAFLNEAGKIYKFGENTYKRVKIETIGSVQEILDVDNSNIFAQDILSVAKATGWDWDTSNIYGKLSSVYSTSNQYYISLIDYTPEIIEFTIPANRQATQGVPYDIFAIPATFLWLEDDDPDMSINIQLSQDIFSAIIKQTVSGASGDSFDFQLLPYCPLEDRFFTSIPGGSRLLLSLLKNETSLAQYQLITDSNGLTRTVILYASDYEFSKKVYTSPITCSANPTEFKIENECDTYRLCSPNYNGQFEFSAAKNGGVTAWNISYSYKPYTPYIKVAPEFGRLYGKNFFDARGLICGGDFSWTQTNDAWTTYELQNKNYQTMFDRQVQNMEVNNSVQRTLEKWNIGAGSVSASISGAMSGAMASGSWIGGVVGGVVGGAASLAGGIADYTLNEKLRQEAMDYAKDQFGYQLQNIQALPYSLTKVGAQNIDFKYFPFVEKYTCSEIEKQALRDKIDWNGMTVMRIGYIKNFLKDYTDTSGTFIQAQPIRLESTLDGGTIAEDSHLTSAISAELQTGVYFV